ncbi:MAG: Glu/Leu/Phe/Val dehydrogenase dimerization domain-containing protein, partial [Actinomycetales bacterium]
MIPEHPGAMAISPLEALTALGHEEVVFRQDPDSGYVAILALHSTVLGSATGGTRLWPYPSMADALRDALRLSRGMTYKNAVAGLALGGGKA